VFIRCHSNGCQQAFPLLTVDLQRACHNILFICDLFYDAFSISDYTALNGWMIVHDELEAVVAQF
jgi:hypothetical protein